MQTFTDEKALRQWLAAQAKQAKLSAGGKAVYLLAHGDDGITWGVMQENGLVLEKENSVPLQPDRLQQARLFNTNGELLLWRVQDGFEHKIVTDSAVDSENILEEKQVLWGDKGRGNGRFTQMSEGRQGLHHAPPLNNYQQGHAPILTVHHYIAYNDEGQAYIKQSRLVDLTWSTWKRGKQS